MSAHEPPANIPDDIREVWEEIVAGGIAPNPGFEAYCGQIARLRAAQARVSEEGLIVADEKGRPTPHPALEVERRAQAEIRSWGIKFGRRTGTNSR